MSNDIKVVTCLNVKEYTLTCPYCEEVQEGFCGDARGEGFECEYCGKTYKVHAEADFEMY